MLKVGIHENIVLKNCSINTTEDGKLSVDFSLSPLGAAEQPEEAETYDENGMLLTGNVSADTTVKVWAINCPKEESSDGKKLTMHERISMAKDATAEQQNIFNSFARLFLTQDKIKFDRFADTGITLDKSTWTGLLDQTKLTQISRNLATQFIAMCSEYFGKVPFRILLKRQSKTKHFVTFRDKYVASYPFVESMLIPKEASKLAFTKYEINNGLDNPDPVTETDTVSMADTPPVDLSAMFGTPTPTLDEQS